MELKQIEISYLQVIKKSKSQFRPVVSVYGYGTAVREYSLHILL